MSAAKTSDEWNVLGQSLRQSLEAGERAEFTVTLASLEDTDTLGAVLLESLPRGTVVTLHGTLGAGKTRLVQAVAAAAGVNPQEVTSPTFVLMQPYPQASCPIDQVDVYRLKDEDEFLELGPEECFDGDGLTFIEWAEKVESCLPRHYVTITLTLVGENAREVRIQLV